MTTRPAKVFLEIVGDGPSAALHRAAGASVVSAVTDPAATRRSSWWRRTADPLPRVAVIANGAATHLGLVESRLEAGCPVLVDPALVASVDQATRLETLDAGRGLVRYGEHLRSAPAICRARAEIAELGPLTHFSLVDHRPRPEWSDEPEPGEGVLVTRGIGAFGVTLALLGSDAPSAVGATVELDAAGLDVRAEVELETQSGLVAMISLAWATEHTARWEIQAASEESSLRVELSPDPHLERGGVDIALGADHEQDPYGYTAQLDDFVDRARSGHHQIPGASEGRRVLELVTAAALASATGTVALPYRGPTDRTPDELRAEAGAG